MPDRNVCIGFYLFECVFEWVAYMGSRMKIKGMVNGAVQQGGWDAVGQSWVVLQVFSHIYWELCLCKFLDECIANFNGNEYTNRH